jgi:SAM-dependent methyltransferase
VVTLSDSEFTYTTLGYVEGGIFMLMAHLQQAQFVDNLRLKLPGYFKNTKVLEIGSLNINGSVRSFFEGCDYIGIDLEEGPGVDIVCAGQDFQAPPQSFDVVCSLECFEHNPFWLETFINMARLCRPGGLIFFTCATTGRPEHGTARTTPQDSPFTVNAGWDYYRNLTERDFRQQIYFDALFQYSYFSVGASTCDLYFYGKMKEAPFA